MRKISTILFSKAVKTMAPAFAVSFSAKFLQMAVTILFARILSPEGYGQYVFILGVALIGGRIAGLGWPALMNRFVPNFQVNGSWQKMNGLFRSAHLILMASSLIGGMICVLLAFLFIDKPGMFVCLLIAAVLLPLAVFRLLYRNILSSLLLPQHGLLVDEFIPPFITLLILLLFWGENITIYTAAGIYIAACCAAVIYGAIKIKLSVPSETKLSGHAYEIKLWMLTALPALVGVSAKLMMSKADIIMLAPLSTMEQVGFYGSASRLTILQTFPVVVLVTVLAPRLSKAFSSGKNKDGLALFYLPLALATLYSTIIAGICYLYSNEIMRFAFGLDYEAAGSVLSILMISQVAVAMNIPVSSFMIITGHQRSFGALTIAVLLLNIVLNYIFIPTMGATGAALAACIAMWVLILFQAVVCMSIIRRGNFLKT